MAKLRRPILVELDAAVLPPGVAPIRLTELCGPTACRPGLADPARDRLWLRLRREIGQLVNGRLDPRHGLALDAAGYAAHVEAVVLVVARHYRDDARVLVDDTGAGARG